ATGAGCGRAGELWGSLPVTGPPLRPRQVPAPAFPAPGNIRRFLVVDDNADAALSLEAFLRLFDHEVRVAFDGVEAVTAASTSMPDVILLDVGLPRLNGYQAARKIRDLPGGQQPIIVALTGWGQDEDRRESSAAGFDAHLVKPVDPTSLLGLLDELEKRRAGQVDSVPGDT